IADEPVNGPFRDKTRPETCPPHLATPTALYPVEGVHKLWETQRGPGAVPLPTERVNYLVDRRTNIFKQINTCHARKWNGRVESRKMVNIPVGSACWPFAPPPRSLLPYSSREDPLNKPPLARYHASSLLLHPASLPKPIAPMDSSVFSSSPIIPT
ncbi:hypothetical protein BHE74_00046430, partial [Ensete ventricosum]